MNRNLGMVVMNNDSGIGNQSRRLCYMLSPERILSINSKGFSKNKAQHPEWYTGFTGYTVDGFPTNREVDIFLKGLTHVYMIENPFNFRLISKAKEWGIKTYIASNYEFCDNLNNPNAPIPDKFLMPSYWKLQEMKDKFGEDKVVYLPPPIELREFNLAREENFEDRPQRKFLHIVGTLAANDRNGTLSLLEALKFTQSDFSLTIKSQHELPEEYMSNDRRVRYSIGNEKSTEDLYKGFDVMILPRRYGGLSLGCNEALMSGLPVIMPDISPNDLLLPQSWLVGAHLKEKLQTRDLIDVYNANAGSLALKIDQFCDLSPQDLLKEKTDAFDLALKTFSPAALREGYEALWI